MFPLKKIKRLPWRDMHFFLHWMLVDFSGILDMTHVERIPRQDKIAKMIEPYKFRVSVIWPLWGPKMMKEKKYHQLLDRNLRRFVNSSQSKTGGVPAAYAGDNLYSPFVVLFNFNLLMLYNIADPWSIQSYLDEWQCRITSNIWYNHPCSKCLPVWWPDMSIGTYYKLVGWGQIYTCNIY